MRPATVNRCALFLCTIFLPLFLACRFPLPAGTPDDADAGGTPDPATLPDGWARVSGAPADPGGAGAPSTRICTVRTRSELVSALAYGDSARRNLPKIIYVEGMIDLCADPQNASLDAEDFIAQAGFGATYPTYEAWIDAYAAACGIDTATADSMASKRSTLANLQKTVVTIKVGSNTSILGVGDDAGVKNGMLKIGLATNVVIRNLTVLDSYDYFPAWDDGENLINSNYDTISVEESTYVWIDHCTLGDGDRPDSSLPYVTIGGQQKKWVTHDGLLDITNGSDFVTVSWNRIENHDKTMLIGSSDGSTKDPGKLSVTIHHNRFDGTNQRLPRVRFGKVHVYNNRYLNVGGYAIGIGDKARIYSEANRFDGVSHAFARYDDSTNVGYAYDSGSTGISGGVTLVSSTALGWKPSDFYAYTADSASAVPDAVDAGAGAGKL